MSGAKPEVKTGTKAQAKEDVTFVQIRNSIHSLRITSPCELEFTEIVKWDKDKKNVISDSFVQIEILKGCKEDRVKAKKYIIGKNNDTKRSWIMDAKLEITAPKMEEI